MGSSCSIQKNKNKNEDNYTQIATGYEVKFPVSSPSSSAIHPGPEPMTAGSNFNMIMKSFQENNVCMKCQVRNIVCTSETIKVDMTMSYSTCIHCSIPEIN